MYRCIRKIGPPDYFKYIFPFFSRCHFVNIGFTHLFLYTLLGMAPFPLFSKYRKAVDFLAMIW